MSAIIPNQIVESTKKEDASPHGSHTEGTEGLATGYLKKRSHAFHRKSRNSWARVSVSGAIPSNPLPSLLRIKDVKLP